MPRTMRGGPAAGLGFQAAGMDARGAGAGAAEPGAGRSRRSRLEGGAGAQGGLSPTGAQAGGAQ